MTTFNTAMRNRLDKEFRYRQFTPDDFQDLEEKFGKQRRHTTNTLHKFCKPEYGLCKVVKSTPNPNGGGPTKTYAVIEGAQFKIKSSGERTKEYNAIIRANEQQMDTACLRLENAMARW